MNTIQNTRTSILRFTMAFFMALAIPLNATVIVYYDFEDETESGASPNREWTVTDKAGPPFTNVVAEEAKRQSIAPFFGSNALRFQTGAGGGGLSLGDGASGELKTDYASGFVFEAKFHITSDLHSTTQTLIARYGDDSENRTFSLVVNTGPAEDPTGNQRKMLFQLWPGDESSTQSLFSDIRIDQGKSYSVRAVFDPFENIQSLYIEGLDDPVTDFTSRQPNIASLNNSDAPTIIGGRFDAGTVNRFFGYIDDVEISIIPEPALGAAMLPLLCLILILRRRRSIMRK